MSAAAERLARHLETNYGLQLDDCRRRALVEEIDLFFPCIETPAEIPLGLAALIPTHSNGTHKHTSRQGRKISQPDRGKW